MHSQKVHFIVPGAPVPKARARVLNGGRAYTPARTVDYENRVRCCARTALPAWFETLSGPVGLHAVFFVARLPTSRPDLDNLVKSVKDALNGVVYRDDSQVVLIVAAKVKARKGAERAEIAVKSVTEGGSCQTA